ncbi:hypothetical protein B0I26_102384 [Anoxybacillus vitaminiphilus]|uniref:Uncharacterized protein n=1 Tax=Paranoxybacillus vitaminiphilus TaxID=581036 RepID=A0A327YNB8_9BACL|nr:hypothetical protein [Anoxybacillus vitaminiphilus]RAK22390.1 hypothetical protein B0I26_102384 [Anoxybacillus vitaminiphilus]
MYNRMMSIVFLSIGGFVLYRYRYKFINLFFKNQFLQKAFIFLAMNIPFVRKAFYAQVFQRM